ncbi:hypothetical protein [Phenylobacterium sp.]|uniref:hypothetical protein n=1 Tax=Phenylobacterium sp. TaxID=1871053 RepID=UPI003983AB6E
MTEEKKNAFPIQLEPPLAKTKAERDAAAAAFRALAGQGWRSDGPYGPREELYDRDPPDLDQKPD